MFLRSLFFVALTVCASATERPNILLAIADDQSYPHASAYGCTFVRTPAFDRVAREGLLFDRAYTPNAKCAPSRACILTGRNSWQLEEAANHMPYFPLKFRTWMEALKDHGYHTGFTTKGYAPGVARNADGSPRELTGKAYNRRKKQPPTRGISSSDYAGNFDDFLGDCPKGTPWVFWYGSVEPHRGYEFRSGAAKGGKTTDQIEKVPGFWPDNETVRHDMLDYAFEIEHFDRHLGLMLEQLEKSGQLDNTLVVVTADNGMPFPRVKGQEYEMSNHLPLAVMWKQGIEKPGRRVDAFVSFIDLAPTFLEAAGLSQEQSAMRPITGRSLFDIFRDQPVIGRDHVLIGKERHDAGRPHDWGYPIRGIVTRNMLFLRNYETDRWPGGDPITGYLNCDGGATKTEILNLRRNGMDDRFWQQSFGKRPAEELYQIGKDPECLVNLAPNPDFASLKKELDDQMTAELTEQGDPRMAGNGAVFDNYRISSPGSLHYYQRYVEEGKKAPAGWVSPSDYEEKNE